MRLASVILDIPTQALDTPYTYLVPEDAPAEAAELPVLVGCAVLVPFGRRQAVGFVVALEEVDPAVSERPVFPPFRSGSFTTAVPRTPSYCTSCPQSALAKVRPSMLAEDPIGDQALFPV